MIKKIFLVLIVVAVVAISFLSVRAAPVEYIWECILYCSGDRSSFTYDTDEIVIDAYRRYVYFCEYTDSNTQTYILRSSSTGNLTLTAANWEPNKKYYIATSDLARINNTECLGSADAQIIGDNVSNAFPNGSYDGAMYFETNASDEIDCLSFAIYNVEEATDVNSTPNYEACEITLGEVASAGKGYTLYFQ